MPKQVAGVSSLDRTIWKGFFEKVALGRDLKLSRCPLWEVSVQGGSVGAGGDPTRVSEQRPLPPTRPWEEQQEPD